MKKTVVILGICVVAAFIIYHCHTPRKATVPIKKPDYSEMPYIFDKNFRSLQPPTDFSPGKYSFRGNVTADTLDYFKFLGQKFIVQSLDNVKEHYNQVEQYLHVQYSKPDARKLFEIYRRYLDCQIVLATDAKYQIKSLELAQTLKLLLTIQNFRRERLGKETADALFGAEIKTKEYFVRREIILANEALYGKDKEEKLEKLKNDMWEGTVAPQPPSDNDYNRYRLKMQMYDKDLREMNPKDRQKMVDKFREEFFSPEQIEKLHEVDAQMAAEEKNLARYREAERKLLEDKSLTREARDSKIKALQRQFFKQDAEAFRREEDIKKNLNK